MPNEISLTQLHSFVLERMHEVPSQRRIILLRTLASVIGAAATARELSVMADELVAIDQKHNQLVLDFQRRAGK